MEVIYGLLPAMLLLGLVGVAVFFWAVRSGQYDDMEGAAHRVLLDDDAPQDPQPEDDKQNSDNTKAR
ncbi:cytochrome oxidase maturation protein, cbb3-type [Methylophaga lonarensis MPL]|uniref:Cytochrome oxidase maturation protein, cbb3-type n=1 Tax=Methylophaga lonarensis MPL TaxID=1286106 RepID=M7P222_9GAMM|nr:cbb3-type cytochrome oxidase assembly protein CcoS [Methylophaga lonarensis]EMR13546.1 cytochrome oxidase maturation protein, cbb3-type [Methylophaga lonarensis MPL]